MAEASKLDSNPIPNPIPNPSIIFKLYTENKKLKGCACTYVSQVTCPDDCPLLDNGCYAETGPIAWSTTNKLANTPLDSNQIIYLEAKLIKEYSNLPEAHSRPLRLHVVGDFNKAIKALDSLVAAAHAWILKTVAPVFTYTHCWRDIPRGKFGKISILASCEKPGQILEAHALGYAVALIVPSFPAGPKAWELGNGFKAIPCPEQTLGIGCRDCGLCFKDRWLWQARRVIAFKAHGIRKDKVINITKGRE